MDHCRPFERIRDHDIRGRLAAVTIVPLTSRVIDVTRVCAEPRYELVVGHGFARMSECSGRFEALSRTRANCGDLVGVSAEGWLIVRGGVEQDDGLPVGHRGQRDDGDTREATQVGVVAHLQVVVRDVNASPTDPAVSAAPISFVVHA